MRLLTYNIPENQPVISVDRMRKSDEYTIKNIVPSKILMMRAAKGIYDSFDFKGKNVAIICGSGNNGGDGYALSTILCNNDISSTIIRLSDKFSEDGKYYYEMAMNMNIRDELFSDKTELSSYDAIVDCILGTGFKGCVEGITKDAISKINSSKAFVISADINSGLNGDTGEALLAVKSDLTVSIGYYKQGLFINDAPKYIKNLTNADIGIKLI